MKVRWYFCAAGFLLGAAAALLEQTGNILLLLMRPWMALGETLRAWSLSGAAGNAGAWAVVLAISLLPAICLLMLRRKRKQKGDVLWILTSLAAFPALFFLINPTRLSIVATGMAADVACMSLVLTALSLLIAALLTRWAGGLKDGRLTFWMNVLIALAMALIAFSAGWALTESLALFGQTSGNVDPLMELMGASQTPFPNLAYVPLILTLIALIPDLFSLAALNNAACLTETLSKGGFSPETESQANRLSQSAKKALIASVCCAAAGNAASVLLSGMIQGASASFSVSVNLPLTEMMLSCGAMLLARWLAAACRLKRDHDLMI